MPLELGPHLLVGQDTETTELTFNNLSAAHPDQPNICDIALIFLDRDTLNEIAREQYYVRPHIIPRTGEKWTVHPDAFAVHGLTVEYCEREGVDVRLVVQRLLQLADAGVPLIGHNAQFEAKIDRVEIHQAGEDKDAWFEKMPNFCTMRWFAEKQNGSPWKIRGCSREKVLAHYGLPRKGAHGAMGDCEDLVSILRAMKQTEPGFVIEPKVHYAREGHPALEDSYQTASRRRDPSLAE